MQEYIDFALELALAAADVILPFYQGTFDVEMKDDRSPVTEADRRAEALMRERIEQRYPEHGILGEEFGEKRSASKLKWILDPIDGTVSFVNGVPLFGTLVALAEAGEPLLGVIHFPALNETVWAAKGRGCFYGKKPAAVRRCERLADAVVCASGMHGTDVEIINNPNGPFDDELDEKPVVALSALIRRANNFRGWGDCYGHALVATGRADVMVDPVMSPWDIAALVPVIEEAGGKVTDLDGNRDGIIESGSLVSTAGAIHEEVLNLLRGSSGT